MTRYVKDPDDVADYGWDWAPHLLAGETITTSTWDVTAGLTSTDFPDSHTDTKTTIWLSGGSNGRTYAVTNHVTTNQGREKDKAFLVMVRSVTPDASGGSDVGGGSSSDALIVVNGGTVTLNDNLAEGRLVGYRVKATTTFTAAAGSVDLAPGAYTFERTAAGWTYYAATGVALSGGGTPADTTSPTAGTLTATGGEAQVVLSVAGASDETALHATPYAFSTDGGTTWGSWQAGSGATITGLSAGVVTCRHRVRDAAGNISLGATKTATVTAPIAYNIGDDFNSVNTASINGRIAPVGAVAWVTPWAAGLGTGAIAIVSNRAGNENGAARVLPASANYVASCDYDVTSGSAQVRVFARADSTDAVGSGSSSVVAVMRANGEVSVDRGNDYSLGVRGTGEPATGTLALEVIGGTGRVLVNGVAVGASFSVSAATGTFAGFGTFNGGMVDNFQIDYL